MVGKAILLEAIKEPKIEKIVLLSRTTTGATNPKVKEVLLKDFNKIASVKDELGNLDACFHCMGISAMGLSEAQYKAITFDMTKALADICFELNPKMTFNYVSGAGTDSTEKGKVMWARVKGKTENYIQSRGFSKSYMFRPGAILPENGIKSRTALYNFFYFIMWPFFPLLKKMKSVTTTTKIGRAMLNTLEINQLPSNFLSNTEINELAKM